MFPQKLYVVTRADIPPGDQATQSSHAISQFCHEHPEIRKSWIEGDNILVLLSAENKEKLNSVIRKAHLLGINHSVFREPDMRNEITSVAFEPGKKTKKITNKFRRLLDVRLDMEIPTNLKSAFIEMLIKRSSESGKDFDKEILDSVITTARGINISSRLLLREIALNFKEASAVVGFLPIGSLLASGVSMLSHTSEYKDLISYHVYNNMNLVKTNFDQIHDDNKVVIVSESINHNILNSIGQLQTNNLFNVIGVVSLVDMLYEDEVGVSEKNRMLEAVKDIEFRSIITVDSLIPKE